ncbi:MAG: hypothetical protein HY286_00350 [Planctomycetes bacterium]|nr:hypothetical protein [Planctomycetota bacterium]
MERRRRSWIFKLTIALAIFVASLELGGRFAVSDAKIRSSASAAEYFDALGVHSSDGPPGSLPNYGPNKGFRFVVIGDSTAVGFPYGLDLSFGKFLAAGLEAAIGKPVDCVVVGEPGRSSAGVVSNLRDASLAHPDCVLLYIGHNEFAHRISLISPFGRTRRGFYQNIFHGLDNILFGFRDWTRSANPPLPEMFPSELKTAATLLTDGDPEQRARNLPLEESERGFHIKRFEANIRTVAWILQNEKTPLFIIQPESSLSAAPLASGRIYDSRALDAYDRGRAALASRDPAARALLEDARDLDPAPIRMSTPMLKMLKEAAAATPIINISNPADPAGVETDFVDMVHPRPALAAAFAERIALKLPPAMPHLDAGDAAAIAKFRAAIANIIDRPEHKQKIDEGEIAGKMLMAHMHLQYGNRAAAEEELKQIAPEKRNFGMFLLLDLAIRFRGGREEADALLNDTLARRKDWAPAIAWWRGFAGGR